MANCKICKKWDCWDYNHIAVQDDKEWERYHRTGK